MSYIPYKHKSKTYRGCKILKFNDGSQTVIESIIALSALLVDYGEATVRSDVMQWQQEHIAEFKEKCSEMKKMHLYSRWFEFMVQTMNKYGLLFDTMPKGYSNVEMTSIE